MGAHQAALLACFGRPTTIADALIAYCVEHGGDPRELLMQVHGFLDQLAGDGIIVRADSPEAALIAPSLDTGHRLDGFLVTRCVSFAIDVEIYEVRDDHGRRFALKIARQDSAGARDALDREAEVLTRLGGTMSPALVRRGHVVDRPYVAMSWHDGIAPDVAAQRIARDSVVGRARLAQLCRQVVAAYVELHRRGVVHGDVHPGNILVGENTPPILIDFCVARILDDVRWSTAPRTVISMYDEPENAAASRASAPPVEASASGDQYSLAALLFRILTGVSYLRFSMDEDELRRQIVEDAPRSFSEVGAIAWPTVEAVLRKALSKRPEDRFASMNHFADAFANASRAHVASRSSARATSAAEQFVRQVSTSLADMAHDGRASDAAARIRGAGAAFALYRLACATDDYRLLAAADIWATKALSSPDPLATEQPLPLAHTTFGAHLVDVHVQSAFGDRDDVHRSIDWLCRNVSPQGPSIDVTFGQAGMLLGLSQALDLPDICADRREPLVRLGQEISRAIETHLFALPRIDECAQLPNLGIAHGWAGFLYSMMRWSESVGQSANDFVQRRLRELEACAELTPRGARWPWRNQLDDTNSSFMPGWCNGSAGFVHLWLLAARTVDASFDALARRAAWDTWESHTPAWDLCCGNAGRAYAMLAIHRHTGEREWLERALRLAARAIRDTSNAPLDAMYRPTHDLMRGAAGVAVLAAELANIDDARMPLFERERWPALVMRAARA